MRALQQQLSVCEGTVCVVFCAQLELQSHDTLQKHWQHLVKKDAKAMKNGIPGHVPVAQRPEAAFLPALLTEFLQVSAT